MTERYFEKFKQITYANAQCIDLTQRVVFSDNFLRNPYVFYPYELNYFERPDQFAYRYYDDQYYAWLLYLTNDVIDPYYDWYIPDNEFKDFIVKKYKSLELAQQKIKFYRNNWEQNNIISISEFNALPASLIRYWEPQYTVNGSVLNYMRKKEDIIVNTNNIRSYAVNNNVLFINDEIVKIKFNSHEGRGQVLSAIPGTEIIPELDYSYLSENNKKYWEPNPSDTRFYIQKQIINLQHTSGVTLANSTVLINNQSYLYGQESGTNAIFSAARSSANNFLPEEEVYYSPVTYYDYENEKNEYNKNIQVFDKPYAKGAAKSLKDLLKE